MSPGRKDEANNGFFVMPDKCKVMVLPDCSDNRSGTDDGVRSSQSCRIAFPL